MQYDISNDAWAVSGNKKWSKGADCTNFVGMNDGTLINCVTASIGNTNIPTIIADKDGDQPV